MQFWASRGAVSTRSRRSRLAVAALALACAGAVAPVHEATVSAQSLTCSSGTAVPNPTDNADLVTDCENLLTAKGPRG